MEVRDGRATFDDMLKAFLAILLAAIGASGRVGCILWALAPRLRPARSLASRPFPTSRHYRFAPLLPP